MSENVRNITFKVILEVSLICLKCLIWYYEYAFDSE